MRVMRRVSQKAPIRNPIDHLPFSPIARLKTFDQIRRRQPLALPRQYWIEITNKCNLRCVMCPVAKGLPREAMTMGFSDFKHIIDQIYKNKPSIMLHVAGEPLVNPNVMQMIDHAKSKGCRVGMHTNATLLTREISQALLATELDSISFSFDGSSAEVYEKIRVGASFEKVKAQILSFLQMRQERNLKKPFSRIEILDMPQTCGEIDQFIDFWRTTSIDFIFIRHAGNWLGVLDCAKPLGEAKCGYRPCGGIFDKCVILVDGTVVPCCRDILGRLALGNVSETPLDQIWNGELYNALRFQHIKDQVPRESICYKCEFRWSRSRYEQILQRLLKQLFWKNISAAVSAVKT